MEGTDPSSVAFKDQNKANLMTQVSISVNKTFLFCFFLVDSFLLFVKLIATTCL